MRVTPQKLCQCRPKKYALPAAREPPSSPRPPLVLRRHTNFHTLRCSACNPSPPSSDPAPDASSAKSPSPDPATSSDRARFVQTRLESIRTRVRLLNSRVIVRVGSAGIRVGESLLSSSTQSPADGSPVDIDATTIARLRRDLRALRRLCAEHPTGQRAATVVGQLEEVVDAVSSKLAQRRLTDAAGTAHEDVEEAAKFDLKVRVLRPTALTLCETYFERSPEKTMHLRPDALAILLGYAGVRAGCRALVYENCTGLITGAVAERIDGIGKVLNIFSGTTPPGTEVIRMLNLDSVHTKAIVHTPIELLGILDVEQTEDKDPLRYVTKEDAEAPRTNVQHLPSARRAEAIAMRAKRGDVKAWIRDGCDCLVIATRFDVVQVFDVLLKHLTPSGCFAAYCMHLQDAADLQYALQLSKMAMRVELMEVTLVNHQVLPGRSHPAMTDSATGGYIVSGTRIAMALPTNPDCNGDANN